MSRSKWKGSFLCYSLFKKYFSLKKKYNFITIYTRNSTILAEFVGMHFKIHNGSRLINSFITENKIGFKFGEFCYTRKLRKCIHLKTNKKKK